MSVKALQEYTRFSKYARIKPEDGSRETWQEQVSRVFSMHKEKFGEEKIGEFQELFDFAEKMVRQKRVLGSQRALQFGGDPILSKHGRLYNCTVSHCDRASFFQECMYLLLCGCGAGFSAQKHHIAKLPEIASPLKDGKGTKVFVIPDTIEGWSDAIGVMVSSYFVGDKVPFPEYQGYVVEFDFSKIRPAGASISSGSKAPGPDPLKAALVKIDYLLDKRAKLSSTLRPIDAYDVIMHASDAVIAGGVRRSATICVFSPDDEEMAKAKTGSWFIDNPQRGRSNNSALLVRDTTTKEQFASLMGTVQEFGEPGFIWSDSTETMFNPCVEIGFWPVLDLNDEKTKALVDAHPEFAADIEKEKNIQGNSDELSGWSFCNLCEINMKKANTEQDFFDACKAATVIGTMQASYDHFEYLGGVSDLIVKREALLGVSMTGMADSPDIAFNANLQKKGAKLILDLNEKLAPILGINVCARATCVKPAGTSSCILGTASGIHPHHAKRYFRRVQANKLETPLQYFQERNPQAVEESVWSANNTDMVVTFLCEVPDGAKTKNQVDALTLLENVKLTQQNWVEHGTRLEMCTKPWLRHNVSNTISVRDDEWGEVESYIYRNKKWFAGISMLPVSGDKDYPQSPFTAVYTPNEIVREYGEGVLFASGLIVDGMRIFKDNLWEACDCVLGVGEIISVDNLRKKIAKDCETNGAQWKREGITADSPESLLQAWLEHNVDDYVAKVDWVRRCKQFSKRYCNSVREMTYCLKDVHNWKVWCDLSREYKVVDWSGCHEDLDNSVREGWGQAGEACSGGTCSLGEIGISILEDTRKKLKEKK